jgi:all-trans-retinol 13,14-reductase
MEEFDVIIIGSGAGGLSAAICLARSGKKVLVLEQHYVPGGWSHSFTLNGQRFSPGVHYVGMVDEGQSTNDLYKGLGVANDLVFFRMNKEAYEHCYIGTTKFDLPAGFDNLQSKLATHFPQEAKSIKKYLTLVKKVNEQLQLMPKIKGFWQTLTIPFRTKDFGKHALFTLKTVIGWHIKSPLLKSVLNAQCGDHGLPPARASFLVHTSIMWHYINGGFYPMGGGGGVVKGMTNCLKRHGGEVRVKQTVQKILVKDNTAYGVQLQDGTQLLAKTIVSNTDPGNTYLNLVGKEHISKKLQKRLAKTKYSVTSLILFLTLDMDVTAAGIDSGNMWIFRDQDQDKHFDELTTQDVTQGNEFPALFMSCTTIKDPVSYNGRYHNFELVTYIDYDLLNQYGTQGDYHSEAYSAFKSKVIDKFMNTVERMIPGAKQNIVQAELGTPKTNQFYINSTRGNVYGTEKVLRQVGPFGYKNTTEINNLYLCGASTLSHGLTGATYSGIEAASKILKCSREDLLLPDENQKLRIYDAEDVATWPEWVHKKREDKIRNFKEVI